MAAVLVIQPGGRVDVATNLPADHLAALVSALGRHMLADRAILDHAPERP